MDGIWRTNRIFIIILINVIVVELNPAFYRVLVPVKTYRKTQKQL